MIARMKKFVLVAWGDDAARAPGFLRRLGIAHVETLKGSGESCAAQEKRLKDLQTAQSLLSSRPAAKSGGKSAAVAPGGSAEDIASATLESAARIAARRDEISRLGREMDRIREWGDFDPSLLADLAASGIRVRLCEGSLKAADNPATGLERIRLAAPKGRARFAVLGEAGIPDGFAEFQAPARRLSDLEGEVKSATAAIAADEAALDALAPLSGHLKNAIGQAEADLLLENLKAGMPSHEGMRYLGGFVPEADLPRLKEEAAARGWALASDDPAEDEAPPSKVENSPAVRIIQPVFDFLGTVPGYREYDISAWFLGFFTLYFAMIFGDGGYGAIMLAAGLLLTRKAPKPFPDTLKLLFLLGGATVGWGLVTGTWFAIPYESLPGFLRAVTIPWISNGNPDSGTNVKIFCFMVGAVQLTVAHLKNIRRDFPNLKFLAQVGSLLLIVGMFNAVLNLVIDSARFPLQGWALALIGLGFGLVFVFGNWDGNLLKSILAGLAGIIPTFLGTVSVFADIVSYIRLWAVGLAGLAISQTVNGMASGMFGEPTGRIIAFAIGALMGVILLGVGHTLNLVMSVLSVVVHGIRLNTLEFSSHLGMEWSGYKYDPLREYSAATQEQERGQS